MDHPRLGAFLLAGLLLLSGCAEPEAGAPTDTPASTPAVESPQAQVFALPRTQESLHPILSTDKVNLALSGLLWEGLFQLDQSFQPQAVLCQDYWVSEDGLTWTFVPRSGVTFSDGSPLTADDVAASLELARGETSRFSGRLSGVVGVEAAEGRVTVTLTAPNGALPALLDIPIVKAGGGEVPLGTGPYVLTQAGEEALLTTRSGWWQGKALPAETIPLVDIRAADDLIYAFDTGDISLVTADLTGTGSLGFAGDHEVWDCPSSTMIYIGYNCARGPCADAALRRALDRAWDRNTVAVALFSRHAQAAVLPVHPASPLYDQEADQRRGYSTQALGELLAQAGYAQDQEGRWARGGAPLELTFVVSTDNTFRLSAAEYLAGELGRAGITVDLQKLPWSDYVQALERGSFDLYLGATALSADFDPAPLLTGTLNYGGYWNDQTNALLGAYQAASGEARVSTATALWAALESEAPFSTLCFTNQSVLTQWGAVSGLTPTQQDPFYGIEHWSVS